MSRLVSVALLLIAVSLVVAVGCSKPADTGASPPAPAKTADAKPPVTPPPPAKTESAPKTESSAKPEAAASTTPTAPLSAYAWTETPTLAGIPGGPVKGVLNGKPFEPKAVVMDVDKGDKLRRIVFSAKEMSGNSDTLSGVAQVVITTTQDLAPGTKFEVKMGFPHDEGTIFYCHYDGPNPPISVNSPWACALSIDSGEKKPYDPKGEMVQIAGTYKGKIHLCFNDNKKTYIAGDFEAKIRYFGAP